MRTRSQADRADREATRRQTRRICYLILAGCTVTMIAGTATGMHLQGRGEVADYLVSIIIGVLLFAGALAAGVSFVLYCRSP